MGRRRRPRQGFPRARLPEHRPADEARARRNHHLHGRQLHHPRRSILGGLCCLGSYIAATLISLVIPGVERRSANIFFSVARDGHDVASQQRGGTSCSKNCSKTRTQSRDTGLRRSSNPESDSPDTTIRIFAPSEYCLRVLPRISRTALPPGRSCSCIFDPQAMTGNARAYDTVASLRRWSHVDGLTNVLTGS